MLLDRQSPVINSIVLSSSKTADMRNPTVITVPASGLIPAGQPISGFIQVSMQIIDRGAPFEPDIAAYEVGYSPNQVQLDASRKVFPGSRALVSSNRTLLNQNDPLNAPVMDEVYDLDRADLPSPAQPITLWHRLAFGPVNIAGVTAAAAVNALTPMFSTVLDTNILPDGDYELVIYSRDTAMAAGNVVSQPSFPSIMRRRQ